MTAVALSAGGYLNLRREAAGLSAHGLAVCCTSAPIDVETVVAEIEAAEADQAVLNPADLARLRRFMSFDALIYLSLAQGLPVPAICLTCGCSWNDACVDHAHRGCAWANQAATLCTACAKKAVA